jgi:pimeloyl-ACP methyl ester carboxylesterase
MSPEKQLPQDLHVPVAEDLALHVRQWEGADPAFVLVHGLASNSRTWDEVAGILAAAGHRVVSVDQRGHGLSDKPTRGYDFPTVTADLAALLDILGLARPILVGQSWGGNVVLAFAARYPGRSRGLGLVDGGFLDIQSRPNSSWETISQELRPPSLAGMLLTDLRGRMRFHHPDWTDRAIDGALGNFQLLDDGTVRPWLDLDRHMQILRALWEQRPGQLYPRVEEPVLICPATSADNPERSALKRAEVAAAETGLGQVSVHWFPETDHDIHMHRPVALAESFLAALQTGVWQEKPLISAGSGIGRVGDRPFYGWIGMAGRRLVRICSPSADGRANSLQMAGQYPARFKSGEVLSRRLAHDP